MRSIGVNTWVWTSPLTDADLPGLLEHVAALGFDVVELPLEHAGDLSARTLRPVLDATGLAPKWSARWRRGATWWPHRRRGRRATQDYLRACVDLAAAIGAPACAVRSTPPPVASGG